MPLLLDVPDLNHEKCLRLLAFLRSRSSLWRPLAIREYLRCCFQQLPRCSFPHLHRYFANLLDVMDNPEDEMSRRSSCWNSIIVQGPPKERSSQSCRGCSSHLWSDVAFDHWPTPKCNRALRRACPKTGRQECLRAIAQSRRDEDRVHVLVLPRSSAFRSPPPPLLPLAVTTVVEFRDLRRVS